MQNLKVIVPLILLCLQVAMKFSVGRRIEGKNFLELLCELPTNIIFLSISFSFAYIFSYDIIRPESIIFFVMILIAAFVVVTIFRHCKYLSEETGTRSRTAALVLLISINYSCSLFCLYYSSGQLIKDGIKQAEQTPVIKK